MKIISDFFYAFIRTVLQLMSIALLLLLTVIVFAIVGVFDGAWVERVGTVVALGDPRTILPLAFIYFLGNTIIFAAPVGHRTTQMGLWIARFAIDAVVAFLGLTSALATFSGPSIWNGEVISSLAILVVGISFLEAFVSIARTNIKDRLLRSIAALVFLSITVAVPTLPL